MFIVEYERKTNKVAASRREMRVKEIRKVAAIAATIQGKRKAN